MKILISGCNGLLGGTISRYLIKKSNIIYGIDIQESSLIEKILYSTVDVSNNTEVDKYYLDLKNREIKIDAIICCHQYKPVGFTSKDNIKDLNLWDSVIKANLYGTYYLNLAYINLLERYKSGGIIINFGSTYGRVSSNPNLYEGNSLGNPVAYSVSKAGIAMLSKYLAVHYADKGIRVNTIIPHGVSNNHETNFINKFKSLTPINRMMEKEEIIPVIEMLLNNNNKYMTGSEIVLDGGWSYW